jgi:succinate dehydrogenase/fumarate reductase-like Fe-S protein
MFKYEKPDNAKMIKVGINGKDWSVPEGLTMIQAMWYTGHEVIHGIGCLGGVCGACAAVYRMPGDFHLHNALACQTLVKENMAFSLIPSFPSQRADYKIETIADTKEELFKLYPESATCRNCNACTAVCPQGIDVRDAVWRSVFGDFKGVTEGTMSCVMCGLCVSRCIAEMAPHEIALYARRAYGSQELKFPDNLLHRMEAIQSGDFDAELSRLMSLSPEMLKSECEVK